jgi:mannose-6-phosphate isomerase-like protein (cupin superfamily)
VKISRLQDFKLGWFIGNFSPSLFQTKEFEICVKYFKAGDLEKEHYQNVATEVTAIISGTAKIGSVEVGPGDIIEIGPLEVASFEAVTDVALVAIKFPSLPEDKVLV